MFPWIPPPLHLIYFILNRYMKNDTLVLTIRLFTYLIYLGLFALSQCVQSAQYAKSDTLVVF